MKLKVLFTAFLTLVVFLGNSAGCSREKIEASAAKTDSAKKIYPKKYTEAELRKRLTPEQYNVTQEKGTERAYTGKYAENHDNGIYYCIVCNEPLFDSKAKFESGTGWPSFYQPIKKTAVKDIVDNSYGMERTEVVCSTCGAHLGHVFDDGPNPTGLRYCMNSASLNFVKR